MEQMTIPIPKNSLVIAKNVYLDMDCYKTKRNNNVLVVGAAGTGKTRSVVTPNILQATGSYIISDPKGNLYTKYKSYLEAKGYEVKLLNFVNPYESIKYNFFSYINNDLDILKVAHMLIYSTTDNRMADPFWEQSAEALLVAFIAYLVDRPRDEQDLDHIMKLIEAMELTETNDTIKSPVDRIFEQLAKRNPNCLAVRSYKRFAIGAVRTKQSIAITLASRLGLYNIDGVRELLSKDETKVGQMGYRKTALFVQVSDNDRSMDGLANVFFTQAMQALCHEADNNCKDNKLPVPVRFILDDFATNCTIYDFPRMISSIRSRGISVMLMIQAESQLKACFGHDAQTIIGNCDNYLYLGGSDLEDCQSVSYRADVPLQSILNMPVETGWFFRRGEGPVNIENFDIDENLKCWGKIVEGEFLPKGYRKKVVEPEPEELISGEDFELFLERLAKEKGYIVV